MELISKIYEQQMQLNIKKFFLKIYEDLNRDFYNKDIQMAKSTRKDVQYY